MPVYEDYVREIGWGCGPSVCANPSGVFHAAKTHGAYYDCGLPTSFQSLPAY